MMKKILLFLLISATFNSLSAQCDLPFGDFENWDDLTSEFADDYDISLPAETLLSPNMSSPVFRLFDLVFSFELENILTETPVEDLNSEVFGFSRSTDSRTGDYSMKFGGDTNLGYSSIFYIGDCGGTTGASSFSFYYKHFGADEDTLSTLFVTGPSVDDIFAADSINDSQATSQFARDEKIVAGDINSEWQWHQISIEDINLSLTNDSIVFLFDRYGVPSKDNYWLIDDMQWNIETPTVDINNLFVFQLGQSLDATTLYPKLDQERFTFEEYRMYDSSGRMMENPATIWSDAISIGHLPAGNYFFHVITEEGTYAKPFIRY